jgi:hypothetical protein
MQPAARVICRRRETIDPSGQTPWPLTREELRNVLDQRLVETAFEDFHDHEAPMTRNEAANRRARIVLKARGAEVLGLDISARMIEVAASVVTRQPYEFEFQSPRVYVSATRKEHGRRTGSVDGQCAFGRGRTGWPRT